MNKDVSDICRTSGRNEARNKFQAATPINPRRTRPEAESTSSSGLPPIISASKLVGENLTIPDALVQGMLHRGSVMVFGGGSKTNKTFCLMDLAVSVASGAKWWNLDTKKGRVLYIDYELQKPFISQRLSAIVDAKGNTLEILDDIDIWSLRGHAADFSDQAEEMLNVIRERDYSLIVVDPIYKALGNRDENAAGDINSLMNEIDKIAQESGAAVVIGHHFSKGNQAGKESMDRISGSGVFGRAPDAIVILTKHEEENVYTVQSNLRNFKSMDPFCVSWNYPLMEPTEEFDPTKLKKPGAAQKKFSKRQLLLALGDKTLTRLEWLNTCISTFKMGPRTFADLKKELVDAKEVVECSEHKWKATDIPCFSDLRLSEHIQKTQLQIANATQTPAAANTEGTVAAIAAAALS